MKLVITKCFLVLLVNCVFVGDAKNATSPSVTKASSFDEAVLDAEFRHLWWMVQITDVHIDSFADYKTLGNFKRFVDETLPVIKPFAVAVTGDITNGVVRGVYPRTGQQLGEWRKYKWIARTYFEGLAKNKSNRFPIWLDTRGNHDSFDVPSSNHYQNLYSSYSVANASLSPLNATLINRERLSICQFKVNGTNYGIVVLDAAPEPGLRGPYNFFGALTQEQLTNIRDTDESLKSNRLTVWVSHYPTSTIATSQKILGNIIRYGAVYLCGHYHDLRSFEHNCYARHSSGQLELELSDFRKRQKYRILAVDHGLVSFVDETVGIWPVVLVTNPKLAAFVMPGYEPLVKIQHSTHIRILVFSPDGIDYVHVTLNGKALGFAEQSVSDPSFFTLRWNPSALDLTVMHELAVTAVDKRGNSNANTRLHFYVKPSALWLSQHGKSLPNPGGLLASSILINNLSHSLEGIFYFLTLCVVVVLLLLRYYFRLKLFPTAYKGPYNQHPERDCLFLFCMFVACYPAVGPLYVGEMLTGCYGVVLPLGILLFDGRYISEPSLAYLGIWHQLSFAIPVMLYFLLSYYVLANNRRNWCRRLISFTIFASVVFLQLKRAYFLSLAYGWLALVTNIPRFWMVVLFIYVDIIFRKRLTKNSATHGVYIF